MRIKCLNIVWYEFSCKALCCTKEGIGGVAKTTPPPVSRRSSEIPRRIFLKKQFGSGQRLNELARLIFGHRCFSLPPKLPMVFSFQPFRRYQLM
nr:MAG TPA: hypothetical protein [Caudoviricetes sp.]